MNMNRPEFFLIVVVLVLIGISLLAARIGGWTILATFYRFSGSFIGEYWRFQSGELRWKIGYNNCLTVGVNPAGLYLSAFFLFRFGHPNLFIPWDEISITPDKRSFLSIYTEFRFRQAPRIPLRVNERLAHRMMESAGNSWPGDSGTVKIDLKGG